LLARGGFEVDINWENGQLQTAKIRSLKGNPLKVTCQGKTTDFELKEGEEVVVNRNLEKL